MTDQTIPKPKFSLFNVHCQTPEGLIGDWTAIAVSPEAAHIWVQRRLLMYFGAGVVQKLPRHGETQITEVPAASAETLKNPGLLTEKVTFPAQTFETTFGPHFLP